MFTSTSRIFFTFPVTYFQSALITILFLATLKTSKNPHSHLPANHLHNPISTAMANIEAESLTYARGGHEETVVLGEPV